MTANILSLIGIVKVGLRAMHNVILHHKINLPQWPVAIEKLIAKLVHVITIGDWQPLSFIFTSHMKQ